MDARGWIAIPLIASFNCVRQLTMDINIVREVLCISSIVQVTRLLLGIGMGAKASTTPVYAAEVSFLITEVNSFPIISDP